MCDPEKTIKLYTLEYKYKKWTPYKNFTSIKNKSFVMGAFEILKTHRIITCRVKCVERYAYNDEAVINTYIVDIFNHETAS